MNISHSLGLFLILVIFIAEPQSIKVTDEVGPMEQNVDDPSQCCCYNNKNKEEWFTVELFC